MPSCKGFLSFLLTTGVPCRHFWVAHKDISAAAFYLGVVHTRLVTTYNLTKYELVSAEGVVGTAPRVDTANMFIYNPGD